MRVLPVSFAPRLTRSVAVLTVLAVGWAVATGSAPARVLAQDTPGPPHALFSPQEGGKTEKGGGDKKPPKPKPKKPKLKKTDEQKQVEAVGAEFRSGSVNSLLKRWPAKGKVFVGLGKNPGDRAKDQAKKILKNWFDDRTIRSVKFQKMRTTTKGDFKIKLKRKGQDEVKTRTLRVTVEKKGAKFVLQSLELRK